TFYATYILPGPSPVWHSFTNALERGAWWTEVSSTLSHMFTAFALILGIGLPAGIVIGRFWVAEDLSRIFLIFLQTVPTIVLIVLVLFLVGINDTGVIIMSCTIGFYTLLYK